MRIDSLKELNYFLTELKAFNIKLPENVTIEIDSPILRDAINAEAKQMIGSNIEFKRGEYYGVKITFKQ
ncbi:unnamed protein product [marine sediment metagenome]|uniref:Uncharacterized protein n=1 Tax=marine sediment metagenome TaxID=412755 RepID=X0Z7V8_9ZZZZ